MARALMAVASLAVAIVTAGCKKSAPPMVEVEGFVRFLDGRPVNKAAIRFVPVNDGAECSAFGVTDESGHYRLTCKGRPGACAGEYQVILRETEIPADFRSSKEEASKYLQTLNGRPLLKKYTNLAETPLTAEVTADKKEYNFDLETGP